MVGPSVVGGDPGSGVAGLILVAPPAMRHQVTYGHVTNPLAAQVARRPTTKGRTPCTSLRGNSTS